MKGHDSAIQTFVTEAGDLLAQVEQLTLDCEQAPQSREPLVALFRTFHTLKGAAGTVGQSEFAGFAHHTESLLDLVRNQRVTMTAEVVDLVLGAADVLRTMLGTLSGGPAIDPARRDAVVAAITKLGPASVAAAAQPPAPTGLTLFDDEPATTPTTWSIQFTPDPTLFARGIEPAEVINGLRQLGTCTVRADLTAIPELEALDPTRCQMSWAIRITTAASAAALRDVFAFVENDSTITIAPVAAAAPTEPTGPVAPPPTTAMVRVPADRLDRLVKMVGELVIAQARITQIARLLSSTELATPMESLDRLVGELRDHVLSLRMLPIGATFGRFRRLVRDLSTELGKEVDMVTEGEETELDKTMLDQLAEPLVHVIRNAIDHGFELPDVRARAGKARRGTLRLSAAQVGTRVVVSIADDGRGPDDHAIRDKAIRQGLLAPGSKLSRAELHNLIFVAGFSTASRVTEVSGRGVGMDVVRRQVEALRGSVALHSEVGLGTRIELHLPLTLAIIDGLLVDVSGERMVIPMAAVTENVELVRADRAAHNGRPTITVRGEMVPYLDLAAEFGFPASTHAVQRVVLVEHGRSRLGLLVDRILGVHQAVIQSLRLTSSRVTTVSGATILGDGRVALILDLSRLIERPAVRCTAPPSTTNLDSVRDCALARSQA